MEKRLASAIIVILCILPPGAEHLEAFDWSECGSGKGCFMFPENCEGSSCVVGASYRQLSSRLVAVELIANDPKNEPKTDYSALGFSTDTKMGDDYVVYCIFNGKEVRVQILYNKPNYTPTSPDVEASKKFVFPGESEAKDGSLLCRFNLSTEIPTSAPSAIRRMNTLNAPWYLLLAAGPNNNGEISYHGDQRTASGSRINVASTTVLKMAAPSTDPWDKIATNLKKAHGLLMVLGWWLFIADAILLARYFKEMWPQHELLDKPIWFTFHWVLNGFGVLLVLSAFVCIFVAKEGAWRGPELGQSGAVTDGQVHSLLGMLASLICFVQPLAALFRPSPASPRRPLFNWCHRLFGILAWILAAVAIWYATMFHYLSSDLYGDAPRGLMIGFWCFCAADLLFLEAHMLLSARYKDGEERLPLKGVSGFGTHDFVPGQRPLAPKMGQLRTAALVIFFVVALAIILTLSCFIGLS